MNPASRRVESENVKSRQVDSGRPSRLLNRQRSQCEMPFPCPSANPCNSFFDCVDAVPGGRRNLIDRQTSIYLRDERELLFCRCSHHPFC
jgi:hypothetical protein